MRGTTLFHPIARASCGQRLSAVAVTGAPVVAYCPRGVRYALKEVFTVYTHAPLITRQLSVFVQYRYFFLS